MRRILIVVVLSVFLAGCGDSSTGNDDPGEVEYQQIYQTAYESDVWTFDTYCEAACQDLATVQEVDGNLNLSVVRETAVPWASARCDLPATIAGQCADAAWRVTFPTETLMMTNGAFLEFTIHAGTQDIDLRCEGWQVVSGGDFVILRGAEGLKLLCGSEEISTTTPPQIVNPLGIGVKLSANTNGPEQGDVLFAPMKLEIVTE